MIRVLPPAENSGKAQQPVVVPTIRVLRRRFPFSVPSPSSVVAVVVPVVAVGRRFEFSLPLSPPSPIPSPSVSRRDLVSTRPLSLSSAAL
ncbi:unnamed protein product [Linum trigynum]|uniref:Uncharacterized protein n=1 Tax=Linum trigynum TaxID=586398 RepID=A0AAV2FMI0_9ROSI